MKFTPEVLAALATLRANADNDFERHRIDVLIKDLTEPPTVEKIDETRQKFDGVVYRSYQSSRGYFNTLRPLHRVVWAYYHGEVPDGCEIHHRDHNPANNAIDNLQCLTKEAHRELHRYNKKGAKHRRVKCVCIECGQEYEANLTGGWGNKFCSSKCNYEHHKKSRPPYKPKTVTSTCPVCGRAFVSYPSRKQKYCSQDCFRTAQQDKFPPKKCAWCGKEFRSSDRRAACCSLVCAGFLREKQKRDKKTALSRQETLKF